VAAGGSGSLPAALSALRGCTVRRFIIDDSLTLVLQAADREATLRIDAEAALERSGERHAFSADADPCAIGPALTLIGERVAEVGLAGDGCLTLRFGEGSQLSARPHDHQVSWSVQAGASGSAACLAEGRVVWE
jgi:hypothetical protein